MAELIDLSELQEKVILVAVSTAEEEDTPASLDELEELASTAGAVTVARIIQNRERVHPGTYLGKGKIDEVRELLWDTRATGVICDDELSPAQLRNLEDALDTRSWTGPWSYWISLLHGPAQERARFRWSWPS